MHDGRLDVLIQNQGVMNHWGNLFDISEENFMNTFEVNVMSMFYTVKECLPMLKKSRQLGGLANVAINSSLAAKKPHKNYGVYCSSKAALDNLMMGMSQALLRDGIRVNSFAPGIVETKMMTSAVKQFGGEKYW